MVETVDSFQVCHRERLSVIGPVALTGEKGRESHVMPGLTVIVPRIARWHLTVPHFLSVANVTVAESGSPLDVQVLADVADDRVTKHRGVVKVGCGIKLSVSLR